MIKKLLLIFTIMGLNLTYSQRFSISQLDSVFKLFTYYKGVKNSEYLKEQPEINSGISKCGLELVNYVKQNFYDFSFQQQQVLSPLLQRPQLQTNVVTPKGYFRVHYDLSGINSLGYDLNNLLQALDSVYNFEINYLGFSPPPSDQSEGGDDKYDVYIQNLSGLYGYTQFESKVSESRFTSFMVIDNDYVGYYSTGINGAKVTLAHEFHHAIQSGSYAPQGNSPFRSGDVYFYEITSTAMEEFVFNEVNDYYAYMPSYFQNPARPMPLNDGYNLAIWNLYLQKNFGFEIIKRQWELIPTNDALKAIALSVSENGSNLGNELNKFGIWTYFTNNRSIFGKYFDEASNYPLVTPTATMQFTPPFRSYNMNVGPAANYYFRLNLPALDGTFITIVTNSDWQNAISDPNQIFPFTYSIFNDTISGVRDISENYSITFSRENQPYWNNAGILNGVVVYGDSSFSIPDIDKETYTYPSPFKFSSSTNLRIVFESSLSVGDEVNLIIYSSGLEVYFSGNKAIKSSFTIKSKNYCEVIIDKSDADFRSGVYIYSIKSGVDIYSGKIAVIND